MYWSNDSFPELREVRPRWARTGPGAAAVASETRFA